MNSEQRNEDCLFCKIAAGELPSEIVYQDDDVVAFRDINPIAPIHLLVIPRKHIPSILDLSEADIPLLGRITRVANQLAREQGIADSGYRLIINCGKEAGQTVPHLHMHLLGGRPLTWSC
jgi:histidine triad (HIT) family protein